MCYKGKNTVKKKKRLILIQLKCYPNTYKHFWHVVEKNIQEIKKQRRWEVDSETRQGRRI